MQNVQGEGPYEKILILGEGGGDTRPFVDPAGRLLRRALSEAGLATNDVRLEHLCVFTETGVTEVIARVKPKVVVALGDTVLRAVLQRPDLTVADTHCYVLPGSVIPALDPRTLFQTPDRQFWLTHALRKARALLEGRVVPKPPNTKVRPTYEAARAWIECAKQHSHVAIDIEKTRDTHEITCIALAFDGRSMSIPLADKLLAPYWSEEEEGQIWIALRDYLASPGSYKIFQNYIFDAMVLGYFGLPVKGPFVDTLVLANLLNPELPKGLDDLARIYCYCEPWKNNKDWNLTGNVDAFWQYNALDALYTLEICEKQFDELQARKLNSFYEKHVEPLYVPVLATCSRGMPIAHNRMLETDKAVFDALRPLEDRLREIADPLVPPKVLKKKLRDKENDKDGQKAYRVVETKEAQTFNPRSPTQVKQVLEVLGYRIPSKDGKECSDRSALLKLSRKRPSEFIRLLLQHTKLSKLRSSYTELSLDTDGRLRYTFNIGGTKSGRFSSSSTPWDTGLDIQTIPRKSEEVPVNIRNIFVAEVGEELVQVDLSQAELRVVAWLAREEKMISLMESGQDVHQFTADEISRISSINCPRQLGKRINHACVTGDHEILTPNGWIRIDAWKGQDIATWYADYSVTFEKPLKYHEYAGPNDLISVQGRSISIIGTPNHGLPVASRWQGKKYIKKQALQNLGTGSLPLGGYLHNPGVNVSDNMLRCLAMLQADAHINSSGAAILSFVKQRKIERCKALLAERAHSIHKDGTFYLPAASWLDVRSAFDDTTTKTFNFNFLLSLNQRQRDVFLAEVLLWDGHTAPTNTGRQTSYFSTNQRNVDCVMTLLHLSNRKGYWAVRIPNKPNAKPLYAVSFNKRSHAALETTTKHHGTTAGQVYCFTTKSGYFLLRHDGKIYCSSNSNYGLGAAKFADSCLLEAGIDLCVPDAQRLLDARKRTFPAISLWHRSIEDQVRKTRRLVSPQGRERYFYGLLDNNLFRKALSFIPQATVVDVINQAWIKLFRHPEYNQGFRVLMQGHDSLLLSVKPACKSSVLRFLDEIFLTEVLLINGQPRVIPHDISCGPSWGELVKCS